MLKLLVVCAEISDPDVSETHRIVVILEMDRAVGRMRLRVGAYLSMEGWAVVFLLVVKDDSVVNDG